MDNPMHSVLIGLIFISLNISLWNILHKIRWFRSLIDKRFFRDWDKYVIEDGMLLKESAQQGQKVSQLVMPEKFQTVMLRAYHDDLGHRGRAHALSPMKRRLVWPGINTFVIKKSKDFGKCIQRKVLPARAFDLISIVNTAPVEVVCIDYLSLEHSKGGFDNILVLKDTLRLFLPWNKTAQTTAKLCMRISLFTMDSRPGFIVIRELTSSQIDSVFVV